MASIECKNRSISDIQELRPPVQVDETHAVTIAKVRGNGARSDAICMLLTRDINSVPFCKAPSHSETDCPVALFYNGTITYKKANELLDKAYGKPQTIG